MTKNVNEHIILAAISTIYLVSGDAQRSLVDYATVDYKTKLSGIK